MLEAVHRDKPGGRCGSFLHGQVVRCIGFESSRRHFAPSVIAKGFRPGCAAGSKTISASIM